MPSYVLKCEGCGSLHPFVVQERELSELEKKKPLQKHCRTCRTTTYWAPAFAERRSGQDRRAAADRRGQT